jgi:predicted transcriptional regulator
MSKSGRQQGELEALILDALWNSSGEPLTSQQILELVSPDGSLALTTIVTVLSRLVDKELVTRKPGAGRSLLFSAAQSREQHTADLMLKLVSGADNPSLAFSHFADGLTPAQLEALRNSLT